jgi:hypothetical protein
VIVIDDESPTPDPTTPSRKKVKRTTMGENTSPRRVKSPINSTRIGADGRQYLSYSDFTSLQKRIIASSWRDRKPLPEIARDLKVSESRLHNYIYELLKRDERNETTS